MDAHYVSLIISYGSCVGLWFLASRFLPIWESRAPIRFKKAYLEFIYSVAAVIVILLIGQLYIRDLLIPGEGEVIDAFNQALIFSPTIWLVLVRKQDEQSVWLPFSHIATRLLIGFAIAVSGILVYWGTRSDAPGLWQILSNTYHVQNTSHAVQVFMEDLTIALVFVRLQAWIGTRWTIGIVAALFAAGHIPSMVANGASLQELSSLILDTGLGVMVLWAVSRSRDIWWFFMVHFAMDMMQFYG